MTPSPFPSRRYQPGEVLFHRGDAAETFYVIQQGEVDFHVPPADTFLVRLGAGASFGEQALLRGGIRNAKAVAVGELVCTEITAQALQDQVLAQQTLIRPVLEALLMQLSLNNAARSVLPELFRNVGSVRLLEHFQPDGVTPAK
jgi:CRP-like cAMP-binding protein